MIKLNAVREGLTRYVQMFSFLVGPIVSTGVPMEELTSFRSHHDGLSEVQGIYHENHVVNWQAKGEISFEPYLASITRSPRVSSGFTYPDNVNFPYWTYGVPKSADAVNGVGHDRAVAFQSYNGNYFYHYALEFVKGEPNHWVVYSVSCIGSPSYASSAFMYHIYGTPLAENAASWYPNVTRTQYTSLTKPAVDWKAKQTFDFLKSYCLAQKVFAVANPVVNCPAYTARFVVNPVLSPQALRSAAESIVEPMRLMEFPLALENYGDMAMRASEKVNANKVNMLEFLSDLRHPLSLIPKLRNLRNVKGLASTYLGVEFGVLPTISDISSIVAACQRLRPFLDRNGFEVLTSASSASGVDEEYSFFLEQHLKMAIDEEDSGLQAIIAGIDNLGALPTFQNVWDLVPYSFLVDWLVDVGDFLERVDTRLRLTRLNIRYVTMSYKQLIHKELEWSCDSPYYGFVQWECYHRWVSDQCPTPPLSLHTSFLGSDHWLDAAALFVQRLK